MNRNHTRAWLALSARMVGMLLLGFLAQSAAAEKPAAPKGGTIKVGVLHSLSGTMAISETTLKDTVLMMIDEQNQLGGLRKALRTEMRELADDKTKVLEATILKAMEVMFSLRNLYRSTHDMSYRYVETFVSDAIGRNPTLQAIQWLPRVAMSERKEYEARQHANGLPGFRFTEIDVSGQLTTAGIREEYFPVYFNVPLAVNIAAHGLDMGSDARREAMERARDSGEPAASRPIGLVQAEGQPGFAMCLAIYEGIPKTKPERRKALKGYVIVVFRAKYLIERVFKDLLDAGIGMTVHDVKSPVRNLFDREGADGGASEWLNLPIWVPASFRWDSRLEVAGRDWVLAFQPNSRFIAIRKPWQTLTILGMGLLLTTMLAGYLHVASRRTREINLANAALQREIRVRQQAEEQLQQAKDFADTASRAKSDFLAQMSHELRTPLNGILGYAQILRRQAGLTEKQAEGLETIRQSGEHLLSLINEILDLAKIEAGKMQLDEHALSLPQLLHGLVAIFQQRTQEKGLRLSSAFDGTLPESVYGDERKLRQVLINLLGNAVKFTEAGEIVLRVTASGQALRFEVRDTGPGIPPERSNDLFQPFTQLGDSSEAKEGTGLGLAISKRLVTIMGGDLQVSSTPGVGSCFWFELMLPATTEFAPAKVVSDGAIAGYAGPRRRILIADDKAINRRVLIGMLEPLGFACSEAVNGKDCLRQVAAARPDLILMDIVMPRLGGLDAARQLRRAPESHDIPIIAMSASVFAADRTQCLEIGCDEFIPKPVVADKLLEAIGRCLNLEWIYEEPADAKRAAPAASSEFDIEHLPGPIARALLEAARKGYAKGIVEQAQALEALGDPYIAYSRRLRELGKQFRFEEICAIAEECVEAAARPA